MKNQTFKALALTTFCSLSLFSPVLAQWTPSTTSTTTDISRTGKVGIGISGTPTQQLVVDDPNGYGAKIVVGGTAAIPAWITPTSPGSTIEIQSKGSTGHSNVGLLSHLTGSGPTASYDYFEMVNAGSNMLLTFSQNKTAIPFTILTSPDGLANVNYAFTAWPNGQTGIGIDPGAYAFKFAGTNTKFAVEGLISCRELKVLPTGTPWPDYVFADNYKLRPLSDVAQFISINKHLPQLPSAAVMEKEGVPLGKTQQQIVEALEELYLHVIEIEKENKELKKEVAQLKNKTL